jgi:hypothetical protein
MVVPKVNRGMEPRAAEPGPPLVRVEDRAEHRPAPDEEAEVGGDPWERKQEQYERSCQAEAISSRTSA